MYRRHKFISNPDLILHESLELHAADGLSDEIFNQINEYKRKCSNDLLNFDISYEMSGGYIYINFKGKGKIEDFALYLMPFLNLCAKLNIYISSSVPYYMSWGDYESGSLYFSTDKDGDNNKAVITGISNFGDILVISIPWQYQNSS